MTQQRVQAWLDAYVEAWHSYDRAAIAELFSPEATYRYHPYDEPGSWEARYEPLLIDGDRAVATGETRYADGQTFSNLFVLEFDADGRCRSFTEWFMEHPE